MGSLLAEVRLPERLADSPGMDDLREMLALPMVRANTRLWLDADDRLVAFALVDHYDNLVFEADWRRADDWLEGEIIAWGLACVQRGKPADGFPCSLDASCREDDLSRVALLERNHFIRQELRSLHFTRPLAEPIALPVLPEGFSLRPVDGAVETQAWVALHRAAFGTENMTEEERLAMTQSPDYDPVLDLVAVAPDGRLAGYCSCSFNRSENQAAGRSVGYADPVAVHPDFQRLGLAKALLLAGLHALKQHGIETAALGTSSENIGMQRAAESAGFCLESVMLWFSRAVMG
jgi:ribosomal protein S18 acetylase RimI-like enzyme